MMDSPLQPISLVDSTYRIRWEITKDEFDNCSFTDCIMSPVYTINIGEELELYIAMFPKGDEVEENQVLISLNLTGECRDNINTTKDYRCQFSLETQEGHWPTDFVKQFYSRKSYEGTSFGCTYDEGEEKTFCTTSQFENHFVDNKVILVASFVIFVEGDKYNAKTLAYRDHMEVTDNFVDDIRSMSSISRDNLSDFTIISGNKRFPCHRILLAVRSEYFETLFQNDPTKKETTMEEPPNLVKTMLKFMCKGIIPKDIDDQAEDLILMSDKYGLDLLTIACESSLVNNLTPENAVHTLIKIDTLDHVSKLDHRQKVLDYIKKEADQVVETGDWKKFVQTYPDLITEILLHFRQKEN